MRLIKLSANKQSFNTVEFNREGLSFIVAKQKNPGESEQGQTYNGVGKSLLVSIIHFCLGAKKDNYQNFCEKLPGWEFMLEFIIGENEFLAVRGTENSDKIFLNGEELTVLKFNKKMESLCFDIPGSSQFLSFRSLLSFFIRPRRESYASYDKPAKTGSEYQDQLYNAFLMGLNIDLVQQKRKIRKEQERIRDLTQNIVKDKVLRDFFSGDKDVALTLKDLDDKIAILNKDISQFQVAEDYYDVKSKGDKIQRDLADTQNQIVLLESQLKNVEESLKVSPDLGGDIIKSIYEESNIIFPEGIKKNLSELEVFYQQLSKNRIKKLSQQKVIIKEKYESLVESKRALQYALDKALQYLGAHHALDVFVKINQQLADLKNERDGLQKYNNLLEEYQRCNLKVKEELLNATKVTTEYLNDVKSDLDELRDFFRGLAKRFYPNSVSGITVYNNDGENQLRFYLEAKIEADASDGINHVKIFCYDLTLLFKGFGHNMRFVFHDSRIFHGIDPRQQADLIKIADELFNGKKYQFIVTINQNQLNEISQNLTKDEFERIITQNEILTLMDSSDKDKLLGVKVDVNQI